MIKDNLHIGQDARVRLISGIRRSAEAVGGTMGTGGSNALLEAIESPGHLMTNDGATILESIHFADPLEEMGRKILFEAVSRANKSSGDGSSTTTVLCASILEEGLKHLDTNSPMLIKKSLEECVPFIEESIKNQTRVITVDEVGAVAAISAEDEGIGNTIQEIYKEIGPKGIIYWDISKTADDSYKIGKGITVDGAGYASPYMCDMDEKTGGFTNLARWSNPDILITKQKITTAAEFEKLFSTLNRDGRNEIVIFCDEIDPVAITQLVQTRLVRGFKTMVVKMPVLWKDWWYEDLAAATGAVVIDPNVGVKHDNITVDMLGKVGNIVVTKDDTYMDGIKDVTLHVQRLEEDGTDEGKIRAARLSTRTARYYVGAQSDSALSYRRLKVEDAINAAHHALNGGVVAGGGVALAEAVFNMPDTPGGGILSEALLAPYRQILKNAGIPENPKRIDEFKHSPCEESIGIDTRTGKEVNMFDAHITDPATVVVNAAKNAISVAAAVLTAKTVVELPKDHELQNTQPMPRV